MRDVLAAGLAYQPGSLVVTLPPGVTGTVPADFTVAPDTPAPGQQTLELGLGTLANAAATPQTVVLTYRATVANVLSNQDGQTVSNQATFSFDDPGTSQPRRALGRDGDHGRRAAPGAHQDHRRTGGRPRRRRSYWVPRRGPERRQHHVVRDGTDRPPAGRAGKHLQPAGRDRERRRRAAGRDHNGTGWVTSPFDIPPGGAVAIVFEATLANIVVPGETLQNEVTGEFSSRDGTDAGERDGAGGSTQDDAAVLDNYNVVALAPVITVADPIALDKRFFPDAADTTATIGEEVTYRLTVSLLEGTVDDVVVPTRCPPASSS